MIMEQITIGVLYKKCLSKLLFRQLFIWGILFSIISLYSYAGMDESGIYRISGVTSDVQKLKKAFEKSKFCYEYIKNKQHDNI